MTKMSREEINAQFSAQTRRMFEINNRTKKISAQQRLEISYRRMEGEGSMDLALEYGVSTRTIGAIPKVERPLG